MGFRKARTAFSVVCGVLCLLLISLWVRSYWRHDAVEVQHNSTIMEGHTLGQYFCLASNRGRCACLHVTSGVAPGWVYWFPDRLSKSGETDNFPFNVREKNQGWKGFYFYWFSTTDYGCFVPHWFLVAIAGALVALPLMRWRFSLRVLLIFTTLIAVVLGLLVWMSRRL